MRKVEPQPNGKFKVRFRLPNGKQSSRTFTRRRTIHGQIGADDFAKLLDAVDVIEALRQLDGANKRKTTPTLDQVAADHIEHLTGIEEGTRLNYTRLWNRTWAPLIGHHYADDPALDDAIKKAVNELATRYAKKSLENQRGLLSAVLERAVAKRHRADNPAKGIRLPEGRRVEVGDDEDEDDGEMVCLTHADWEALYDTFHPHYKAFVRFLVGTGCRWGEAVVLRCGDVDLGAGTVKIRRALKWSPDGKRVIGPPKTKKSKRTVALPAELVGDLKELLRGKAGKDLVFTAPRGGMISHRTFWSKNWRPAVWRASRCVDHRHPDCRCGTGEPQRCKLHAAPPGPCGCEGTLTQRPRIHDMRHTHASWLLAMGVPIHVVQARLGHESIQTTVDTYSHLLPDAQLAAAQAASYAFTRPEQPKGIAR